LQVNPATGEVTEISTLFSGNLPSGADFDSDGTLYAAFTNSGSGPLVTTLRTIDPITGVTALVGPLSQDIGVIGSIAFDPSGVLLGSGWVTDNILFDLDKSNGTVSNVRSVVGGSAPQGMGFAPACPLEVAPRNIALGDVSLGSSSSAIVTASNVGDEDLTLGSIALLVGGDFSVTSAPLLPAVVTPGMTVDVEVTFAPTVEGAAADQLLLGSDVANVAIPVHGNGVQTELPPSEQVDAMLLSFDESVLNGTLVGIGPGKRAAKGRLRALRNKILAAGDLIDDGLIADACAQLRDVQKRVDGVPRPPDFAAGVDAAELFDLVQALRDTLGCR
jgi:hypothetical protein